MAWTSPHTRTRRRHGIAFWLLIAGAVLLFALIVDGVWSTLTLARELRAARDDLTTATQQLEAGDVQNALVTYTGARNAADRAAGAAGHPSVAVARLVPWIGDDIDAIRGLTDASVLGSQAGMVLSSAAITAGWDGESIPGAEPGRLDPAFIEDATPELNRAADLLRQAEAVLAPLETDGKIAAFKDAIADAKDEARDRARQAERAALAAELLPRFLGSGGPRTYALVMMTLSDPRGSGGYPGSYGVVTVDDGRFDLEEVAPTGDLGEVPPVAAPDDVEERYGPFGGLTHFIATTYSPDWPTSARVWMEMWEARGEEPLDGVIGVDSEFMRYVLEAIGSVETPAWPDPIAAENVSQVANADTMLTLDGEESNRWQTAIATSLFEAMMTRPLPPEPFGSAISRATAERHLQVYSADPDEQALLEELDADGGVGLPENPLMVAWNGVTATRTGYFVSKSIEYNATVNGDGTTDVSISLTLDNDAPTSPESILLGQESDDFAVGTYAAEASLYLPADAEGVRSRVDGGPSLFDKREQEFDRPVFTTLLVAEAGQRTTAEITYTMTTSSGAFELGIVPQPELRPTPVSVTVTFPGQTHVATATPGAVVEGSVMRWDGTPTSPTTIVARTSG